MTHSEKFPSDYYIVDVGMHDGADSIFYARRGFKVVSFEANPVLVDEGREKFKNLGLNIEIRNFAISDNIGSVKFYVNTSRPQWSSLHSKLGNRASQAVEIEVVACNLTDQLEPLGEKIHMVKIDIEGFDFVAAQQIAALTHKPHYLSVENGGAHFINLLSKVGYDKFKFSNQKFNSLMRVPKQSKHGVPVDLPFLAHSSGPFGEDLQGRWLSTAEALQVSEALDAARSKAPDNLWAESIGWFDMHARLAT